MPWTADDAERHKKGLTREQKRKWARVANAALKEYADEGRAIRVANAAVSSRNSSTAPRRVR
jgi:uncharacterized protein YdaT